MSVGRISAAIVPLPGFSIVTLGGEFPVVSWRIVRSNLVGQETVNQVQRQTARCPPDFRVELLENAANREDTIGRSKAVGEPPLMLANSVFSAIFDAIVSLKPAVMPRLDAPATPEAIMRAIRATGRGMGS